MSVDPADIEREADIDAEERQGAPKLEDGALRSGWILIRSLLAGRGLQIGLLAAAVIVDTALNISFPLLDRMVIDDGLIPRNWPVVAATIGFFAAGSLLLTVIGFGMDYLNARLGTEMITRLRTRLMEQLLRQPQAYFHNTEGGEALARFSTDTAAAEEGLVFFIPWLLLPALEVVYSATIMFSFNVRLGLVGLLVFPVNYLGIRAFSRPAFRLGFEKRRNEARILSGVAEVIAAHPVIQAFGLLARTRRKFSGLNAQWQQTAFRFDLSTAAVERATYAGVYLIHAVIFGVGAYWAFEGVISVGTFVAFEGLFLTMGDAFSHATEAFGLMASAAGGLKHIQQFLAGPVGADDGSASAAPLALKASITFENVTYAWPGSPFVLGPLNFTIAKGQKTALVGRSGAGKSTLVQLLLGLERPHTGRILIDGADSAILPPGTLRQIIAPVFQENFIFHDTIAQNVSLGDEAISSADVEKAIAQAGLAEWTQGLAAKANTIVGERGARMSGGQRQRLAIARALARKRNVLLLDEAMSSLDTVTAAALRQTIAGLGKAQTIINISHSLGMVRDYDQILVLERGRLAAAGRHRNLLRQSDVYRALWGKEHRGRA